MGRPTERKTCKRCGRHRDDVGQMSHTGQCLDCGLAALRENTYGISEHRGPAFDRWRRSMAASVGGILHDDLQQTG